VHAPNAHALVPLKLAAQLVWAKVYESRNLGLEKTDLLNSIASTLAVLGTIYEYRTDPQVPARPLSRSEIEGGMFRGGAEELHFIDGRAPRRFLAVVTADVAITIEALKDASK
jgi:hypothetical protein